LARENRSFVKSCSHWSRDTARLSELSSGAFECPERSNFRVTSGSKPAFASQRKRMVSLSQDKRMQQKFCVSQKARTPLNRSSLSWNVIFRMTLWMKRGGDKSGNEQRNSAKKKKKISSFSSREYLLGFSRKRDFLFQNFCGVSNFTILESSSLGV